MLTTGSQGEGDFPKILINHMTGVERSPGRNLNFSQRFSVKIYCGRLGCAIDHSRTEHKIFTFLFSKLDVPSKLPVKISCVNSLFPFQFVGKIF